MGNSITCCHPWYQEEDIEKKTMREKGVQTNIEVIRVMSPTNKEWDFVSNEEKNTEKTEENTEKNDVEAI